MTGLPARVPGIVREYDQVTRFCRVEIPGITDGAEELPLAEIEYPIGDNSKSTGHPTEIEILPGALVWLAFEMGDFRYPIITGWRNPRSGNSVDWRRWHHANIELNADVNILIVGGSNVTVNTTTANVNASESVTVNTPETTITGNAHINGNLIVDGTELVKGAITGQGGLAVSGGNGAAVTVQGDIDSLGALVNNGANVGSSHTHTEQGDGNEVSPPH